MNCISISLYTRVLFMYIHTAKCKCVHMVPHDVIIFAYIIIIRRAHEEIFIHARRCVYFSTYRSYMYRLTDEVFLQFIAHLHITKASG